MPARPQEIAEPLNGLPWGDLVAQTVARRRLWLGWIGAEAALLAALLFFAAAGLGAAIVVSTKLAEGAAPALASAATTVGVLLSLWHFAARWWTSRNLAAWAADQVLHAADDRELAELLRSAIEIAQRAQSINALPIGSPRLIERTLTQATAHLPDLDRARLQLRGRVGQFGLLLLVSLLAWVWSAWSAPAIWRQLLRPPPPSVPIARDVGTLVSDLRAHLEPPTYARSVVAAREEEGSDCTILRGGLLRMTAAPLTGFEVRQIEIGGSSGTRPDLLPLTARADSRVQWERAVLEPLRYRYRGVDANGNPVREQTWREVRLLLDAPPKVAIRQPQGEIEVHAGQSLIIDGEVSDDIGLSLVNLVVARPTSGLDRRPIALQPHEGALGLLGIQLELHETISVDALQLRPGEVALVHLEASDNNPLEGARRSESVKLRIRMFSPDRQHAKNLEQLAMAADEWTLHLAERLERDPSLRQAKLDVALKNRDELATSEQRGLESLKALRQRVADDVLGRSQTSVDLQEIERILVEALTDETRSIYRMDTAASGFAGTQHLYALQRQHALVIASQEQAVDAIAALALQEQQSALARDGKSLAEQEKQLVSTLEKLADSQSPALSAEAERMLDGVEQQLDRMAAAAQKQVKMLPYEHLNREGLDPQGLQRDLSDHRAVLAEIRQLLRQGKMREALERMRALQEQMSGTLADLQQGVDSQRTAEEAALEKLVAELRRGIAKTQQGQGHLRDELRESSEEQQRATAEHLRNARNNLLPQVAELLQEARDAIRPQRLSTAELRANRSMAGARTAIGTALGALEHAQLDNALQALMEAEDLLAAARRVLDADDDVDAKHAAADAARLAQGADRVQRAAAKLREALPSPMALLRPPVRQKLDSHANTQEQLRKALEKLRQKLADAGEDHPALQRQVGERMDHALQTMRDTTESLQRFDARQAFEQTAEVLDALERAAQILENQGQSGQKSRVDGEMQGIDSGDEKVELHAGNQGDGVETFRQEVLRAMQQKAPPSYAERLQRYYKAVAH